MDNTVRPLMCGQCNNIIVQYTTNKVQESLADAKVSARQQCVYEDPLSKKSTANLQLMVNSNR